jgi:hypothetical protein
MDRMCTTPECCVTFINIYYTKTTIPFVIENEEQKEFVLQITRHLYLLFIHSRVDLNVLFLN